MNFTEYLIEKGYEAQRFIDLKWKKTNDLNTFSSMTEGGVALKFVKDNSVFYYGLHFRGLPPTLTTPLPSSDQQQQQMIDFISSNDNEIIFNKFYKNSLIKN